MGESLSVFGDAEDGSSSALSRLELLVVQDLFATELTNLATVVLPACAPFERAGTFTNLESRVQRFESILEPRGDTKPDWEIIGAVSQAMGVDFGFEDASAVTDTIASVVPSYQGLHSTHLSSSMAGSTWVTKAERQAGETWLQDDWKGKFEPAPPSEQDRVESSEDYPLLLITGRSSSLWNTGTRSSRTDFLAREENGAVLHMNPKDAEASGVKGGWQVQVVSPQGRLGASVVITQDLPRGLAYLPLPWDVGQWHRSSRRSVPIRVESS
jgi:predicted molibdopterin-dependent oxidoreductase YjgC